ncbi:MAG: NAD(P)-dependent dehydrogenase (short-subunit alcohol dehydrogenase family) [Crocinitomix sp.]|jgi:NAD(P)-dependent dehydrogenase (short-subunit alcohol dehydrogenase family)
MAKSNWNTENISDQAGKTIIITGASSGLGKEAAKVLAEKNATVVMAVRNVKKGETVAAEIRKAFPNAKIQVQELDLNNSTSIKSFADNYSASHNQLDILINNAGIMMCPYSKTDDGFEIQMGTNHFGHFALTGHLMPLLIKTNNSRLVVTSSIAHRQGNIDFSDINWESRKYKTTKAYSDSKLANLYFAYELAERQQEDANYPTITAAHPGWTKTELDRHSGLAKFLGNIVAQTVQMGTLPTLRAATDIDSKSGDYYGPAKMMEMRGNPLVVKSTPLSHDKNLAKKLWDLSEEMTGVSY